jgi:Tfp pilus assembly protein PilW
MVELLIVCTLGLLCLGAILTVVISYVHSRESLEAMMRLQDQWGRLQFLLDREIQESRPVTAASSINGSCGTSTPTLALEVPGVADRIVYYRSGTTLRRCGPTIDANGNLVASAVSDLPLLEGVTSFSVDTSDSGRPSYRVSLQASNGVTYSNQSQPSGTSFRSRVIN